MPCGHRTSDHRTALDRRAAAGRDRRSTRAIASAIAVASPVTQHLVRRQGAPTPHRRGREAPQPPDEGVTHDGVGDRPEHYDRSVRRSEHAVGRVPGRMGQHLGVARDVVRLARVDVPLVGTPVRSSAASNNWSSASGTTSSPSPWCHWYGVADQAGLRQRRRRGERDAVRADAAAVWDATRGDRRAWRRTRWSRTRPCCGRAQRRAAGPRSRAATGSTASRARGSRWRRCRPGRWRRRARRSGRRPRACSRSRSRPAPSRASRGPCRSRTGARCRRSRG